MEFLSGAGAARSLRRSFVAVVAESNNIVSAMNVICTQI
jgi:hypothetical protein